MSNHDLNQAMPLNCGQADSLAKDSSCKSVKTTVGFFGNVFASLCLIAAGLFEVIFFSKIVDFLRRFNSAFGCKNSRFQVLLGRAFTIIQGLIIFYIGIDNALATFKHK